MNVRRVIVDKERYILYRIGGEEVFIPKSRYI